MSPLPRAIGVVMLVVGGLWFLQGIGVARGSVMTGQMTWAVIGGVLVIAGAFVLRRALAMAKDAIADETAQAPRPAEGGANDRPE